METPLAVHARTAELHNASSKGAGSMRTLLLVLYDVNLGECVCPCRGNSGSMDSLFAVSNHSESAMILHLMSASPLRFPGREKEVPFDATPIRKLSLDRLVETVEEVESDELEIKGWCRDERELADKVAEACACIANTAGGHVLVGVSDAPYSLREFSRCPHSVVDTSWLQTKVHDLTQPPVECTPFYAPNTAEVIGPQPATCLRFGCPALATSAGT